MKVYKVGGSVRDNLLGLEPTDNDWVVVGSTPKEMLSMGYKQVGRNFPVFLHPETKEEYALARKERSTGPGHTAFNFSYSPNVTLEEDLSRRDITINAIAMDDSGNLIDPFNGKDDLDNKIIRHVSDAFVEDPLRVLRVARFYAILKDFQIEPSTYELLFKLIPSIKHLPGERIWQETEKVLNVIDGVRYFDLLYYCWKNSHSNSFSEYVTRKTWSYGGIFGFKPEIFINEYIYRLYGQLDQIVLFDWPWGKNSGGALGRIDINSRIFWFVVCDWFRKDEDIKNFNNRLKVPKSYVKVQENIRYVCKKFREHFGKGDFFHTISDGRELEDETADAVKNRIQILNSKKTFLNKKDTYEILEKIGKGNDFYDALIIFSVALRCFSKNCSEYFNNLYTSNDLEKFFEDYYKITIDDEDKSLAGSEIGSKMKNKKMKLIDDFNAGIYLRTQ